MLIPEPPIYVSPSLAMVFGFNEAAVIQELHFWLNPDLNSFNLYLREGQYWIPNLLKHLCQKFFFWDEESIKYMCSEFEQLGIFMVMDVEDSSKGADRITRYHTLNYDVLRSMGGVSVIPVSITASSSSFATEDLMTMLDNLDHLASEAHSHQTPHKKSSFKTQTHEKAPGVYVLEAQDPSHFLETSLLLELQDQSSSTPTTPLEDGPISGDLPLKEAICHLPEVCDDRFKKFIWEDPVLYKIIRTMFQMKVLDQVFLFCESHKASRLVVFSDNDNDLSIYRDFFVYKNQKTNTPEPDNTTEEKGNEAEEEEDGLLIPVDEQTLEIWRDFMETVTVNFRRVLWNGQKTNPLIQHYLRFCPLSDL